MGRRSLNNARRAARRAPHKLFSYLSEGTITEPEYFAALLKDRHIDSKTVRHINSEKTDAKGLVEDASVYRKKNIRAAQKGDEALVDEWWVIADTEGIHGDPGNLAEALTLAKKNSIHLALSNPAFELWLILHYRYTTRTYLKEHEVEEGLKRIWPNYDKRNKHIQDVGIVKLVETALANADKLRHFGEEDIQNISSTDVDKFVISLFDAKAKSTAKH